MRTVEGKRRDKLYGRVSADNRMQAIATTFVRKIAAVRNWPPKTRSLSFDTEEDAMSDETKNTEKAQEAEDAKAPVSEICGNAEELAASLVDDDSEVKPVEGFFLTSQRWH